MKEIEDLLQQKHFVLHSSCSCGGTYRKTYKSNQVGNNIEVILMPNRERFNLRKDYKTLENGTYDELKAVFEKHEI